MKVSFTIQLSKTQWWRTAAVATPILAALVLLGVTLRKRSLMEPFFVHGSYFALLTMVAFWA